MRLAVVTLATGQVGRELLAVAGQPMQAYARRVGADFHALTSPKLAEGWHHGAKFHVRKALTEGGYDRLVYFDADVVVSPDCPDLFGLVPESRAALFDEGPELIKHRDKFGCGDLDWVNGEMGAICEALGRPAHQRAESDHYFNAGVMVLSKRHANVLRPPDKPIPFYHCSEQQVCNLNIVWDDIRVQSLPREFNWAWWYERDDWASATGCHVYHASGLYHANEAPADGHRRRLALMRSVAERLYPDRGPCRHRTPLPVEAQACCNGRSDPDKDVYGCDVHEWCATGFALHDLGVARCRVCPDHAAPAGGGR